MAADFTYGQRIKNALKIQEDSWHAITFDQRMNCN